LNDFYIETHTWKKLDSKWINQFNGKLHGFENKIYCFGDDKTGKNAFSYYDLRKFILMNLYENNLEDKTWKKEDYSVPNEMFIASVVYQGKMNVLYQNKLVRFHKGKFISYS